MQTKKQVVIGEDHTILREGLRVLISSLPDFEVVQEVKNGLEAVQAVDALSPDVVIMDLSMPKMNGIEAIRLIRNRHPEMKILVLTVHDEEEYVLAANKAGADGYVLKSSSKDELCEALRVVSKGGYFLSSALENKVSFELPDSESTEKPSTGHSITPREREVLRLIAGGYTSKQIAELLSISTKTVGTHRTNLMKKLGLHSVSEVTAYALKKQMIDRTDVK